MVAELLFAMMALTPTDQTVNVAKGTKLDVNNFAGDVNVKVWDRDAVRVEVTHSDRETIDIRQEEQMLRVRGRSNRGPMRSLDYTITAPSWMAINVSGTYADTTLTGVGGDVTIETTRGDIKVSGGSGFISLKSVQGEISLEKAKGRIEIRGVNEGIHLADINGDLSAETTNGSIILDRIDSGNVDLYTVNGNISYDGPMKDKGVYRLTTHNGMIAMPVPERANATITLRTYNGGIRSSFQLPGDTGERRNKRMTLTLGNGSAHVELESFGGTIALRRPNEPRPEVERKRRERARIEIPDVGPFVLPDVGPIVDRAVADAMKDLVIDLPTAVPMPVPNPRPRPR
jgi:Putative adhesin